MLDYISTKYFKMATNATKYIESDNDIACKCPVCGDSKHSMNSKRLHLYKKNDLELVNCFNGGCPVQNKTMYSFLRDFYPDLLPRYRKETFRSKIDNIVGEQTLGSALSDISTNSTELASDWESTFNPDIKRESSDLTTSEETWSTSNNQESFCNDWENSEISTNNTKILIPPSLTLYNLEKFFKPLTPEHMRYLENRAISVNDSFRVGKDNIVIPNPDNPKESTLYYIKGYLVIPLYIPGTNNLYGFYSRDIKTKKFITFISTIGYKVWNWFNIDKTKPVYIFEGIFDAMSSGLDNVIANLGAKIPQQRLDELDDPIFCLDNDKTGLENAISYASKRYKVYIQPRIFQEKDLNELKLNNPGLDIADMIKSNIFTGISGVTRLKIKL